MTLGEVGTRKERRREDREREGVRGGGNKRENRRRGAERTTAAGGTWERVEEERGGKGGERGQKVKRGEYNQSLEGRWKSGRKSGGSNVWTRKWKVM